MTPSEKQEYLDNLKILCCVVGFLKSNGELDGAIVLDMESLEKIKKKFDRYKVFFIDKLGTP